MDQGRLHRLAITFVILASKTQDEIKNPSLIKPNQMKPNLNFELDHLNKLQSIFFEDINECVLKKHTCPITAVCLNKIGSFSCLCPNGYSLDITGTRCDGKNDSKRYENLNKEIRNY
jgi:hypothetical protein